MKNGASEQCSWHSETDTKANFGEGCGKEAASDFVIQPQGAGGADSWARWGKVWTLGRSRRVKMVVEVEEKEGRRFEEENVEGRRRSQGSTHLPHNFLRSI